ncbi:MAG: hypothetical protein ACYC1Q_01315, partial [Bacteroidia bacterium]
MLEGPKKSIITSGGHNPLCVNGGYVDLSGTIATPTQTYVWQENSGGSFQPIPGATGMQLANITAAADYRFITTLARTGCNATSNPISVSEYDVPVIVVTANSPGTPGVNHDIDLQGGLNHPTYTSYSWFRNGSVSSSGGTGITVNLSGDYVLQVNSTVCGAENSNTVHIVPICFSGPTNMPTTTGTYSAGPYKITGAVTITGTVNISNAVILADPGSSITINAPSGTGNNILNLNNVTIMGCDD